MPIASTARSGDGVHTEPILSSFDGTIRQRIRAFQLFIQGESLIDIEKILESRQSSFALGSERFVDWLKKKFNKTKRHHQVPLSRSLAPSSEAIIKAVISFYGIDKGDLHASRRGVVNEPRNVAIYLLRELRGDTLLDIGSRFGLARYSSVNSAVQRTKTLREKDKNLKRRLETIITMIQKSQEET